MELYMVDTKVKLLFLSKTFNFSFNLNFIV